MGNPVVHFEVGSADHQALVRFYGELFGWELREASEGLTLIDTRGGQGLNGGVGRSNTGEPWATFYVEVDDLQATLDRAEELGGRTVLGVIEMPGLGFAMFDDPDRPDRATRRRQGKSDPIDAQAAARATLAGVAATTPKTREGQVEMIRVLRVARRGAMKARVAAAEQLSGVLYSAPEELLAPLLGLKTKALVGACAAMRPGPLTSTTAATKAALRTLARRWQQLQAELTQLDAQLRALVGAAAPTLVALPGVGIDTAGQLLVTAGDNPQRLRGESAFAHLCGAAPIPASSGRTHRHRLNRGGDRHANNALWRIALVRMRCHPPTRAYVERRTKQGLSKLDIMRCLKRYIAREVYHHLTSPPPTAATACPK